MAVMDYRTRDGLADFGFSIEFHPDAGWRVYIIFDTLAYHDNRELPPYTSTDSRGRRFVDWPSRLESLGEAKTVAGLWAELVQRYFSAKLNAEALRDNLDVKAPGRRRGGGVIVGIGGGAGQEPRKDIKRQVDPTLSVSVYLEDGQEATARAILSALYKLADELGLELIPESDPIRGSFFQKFRVRPSGGSHTEQEVYERLINAVTMIAARRSPRRTRGSSARRSTEPSEEVKYLAAAALIEALEGERAAIIQFGPLAVVKAPRSNCDSAIVCKILIATELQLLEEDPALLKDPIALMAWLRASGEDPNIEQAR